MTLDNCKRLLALYEKNKDNNNLSEQARLNAKNAYADMKVNLDKRGVAIPVAKSKAGKA